MKNNEKEKFFEDIYSKTKDRIRNFVSRRISSKEDSVDISEEVFYKFWVTIQKNTEIKNPRALLFTIAHNKVIDWYKKKKTESLDKKIEDGNKNETPFDVVDKSATQKIIKSAETDNTINALVKLPKSYARIIRMHFVKGLPIKEVARILGKTDNSTSVNINRALTKLRKVLKLKKK